MFGNIDVVVACSDRLSCNGNFLCEVDVIVELLGRVTVGPGAFSIC